MINVDKLEDVEIEDINHRDFPDFCDAYIAQATINGRDLTEEELEWVNDKESAWVQEYIHENQLYIPSYLL